METPSIFRPRCWTVPHHRSKPGFGILPDDSIFDTREISKTVQSSSFGPDGYVSTVQPLAATGAIANYLTNLHSQN